MTQEDNADRPKTPAKFGRDMTTGSVARNLLLFSLPMLMGNTIHTAYSIINAVWVGKGLGTDAMAAVTVSFPVIFILLAVAGGLTLASNIMVSQAYGAKDHARIAAVARNSLVLVAATSLGCMAFGMLMSAPLVRLMGTPENVAPLAVSFLRIFMITAPLMFGIFHLASILRGMGDSKTPLYFQASSLVMNALLDPFLMFGWLGLPRMGLNGAAVATVISQGAAVFSLVFYLRRAGHAAAPTWHGARLDRSLSLLTLKIGLPSMLQQSMVAMGMLFIVSLVNRFGAHSAAAYGIAMRIDQLAFMPAMAMGMAVSTVAGQNIGAQAFGRVGQVLRWGIIIACGLTLPGAIVAFSAPQWLMGLFIPDLDVIATGAYYLRVAAFGYLLVAVMFTGNGVINGSGHTMATTAFTLVVFWLVRIPLGVYLSSRLDRVEGIWYAILVSYVIGVTLSIGYYRTGRWRKPIYARMRTPVSPVAIEAEVEDA